MYATAVFRLRLLTASLLCLACATPAHATGIGEDSKLPLPRFVSLRSQEVNVRTGPGTRYPIRVVFKKQAYPVKITDEFDYWRKITDDADNEGWVHKNMLTAKRTAVVTGAEQVARNDPEPNSAPLFRVEPGVIGTLKACGVQMCRLEIEGLKGWVPKQSLWGVLPGEVFE
ncbi:MAG: SH3 domain-containing protein [Alphaproteobacteria bacterium]|nr:SH3 domain-containing protein [Alphaproteobacteria bacterium]